MARVAVNWWSGVVLVLEDSETQELLNAWQGLEGTVDAIVGPALSAAGILDWRANLVKAIVKGLFQFRSWNIRVANGSRRGVYITFTWLLFAAIFVPNPITGPLPWILVQAVFNPLYVFVGPR